MERYRRLKLWQKKILSAENKNWRDYLFVKLDACNIYVYNRTTKKEEYYRR